MAMDNTLVIAKQLERLGKLMPPFEAAVRYATRSGAPSELIQDACQLVEQFTGRPGEGAVESLNDASPDLAAAEGFLAKWKHSGADHSCAQVLGCVERIAVELRQLDSLIRGMSSAEVSDVKATATAGRFVIARGRAVMEDRLAITVFALCGLLVWGIFGSVATISSFQPEAALSPPTDVSIRLYATMHAKGIMAWIVTGMVVGISLCAAYRSRPQQEHFTAVPKPIPSAPGPATVAEQRVGCFGAVAGCLLGVCIELLLFPRLEVQGIATVRPALTRLLVGVPAAAFATICTFTGSLWMLGKILLRRRGG
jgi:hypothetical protein